MNLNEYFDPVDINIDSIKRKYTSLEYQMYGNVAIHTSNNPIKDIEDYEVVILGVVDRDSSTLNNLEQGLARIREFFYSLSYFENYPKICDLGNLKKGKTSNDNLIGLRDVLIELKSLNILPIIIGDSEKIIYPNYLANKEPKKKVNLVSIDSNIDLYKDSENKEIQSPLWKVLIDEKDSLFSFTNVGYQTHFVNNKTIRFLSENLHSFYRLGYIRSKMKDVEPIFRDADIIGLNISSVRQSEALGQAYPSPNGFYGEEICQLARYAGMSARLSSFGVFDYLNSIDLNNQTAHLIAQIIWYFINGFVNKKIESPLKNKDHCKKFIVNLDTFEYELIFYKSEETERWWMEIPSFKTSVAKNLLVACTLSDYQNASNGDIPERWLKVFQKIN